MNGERDQQSFFVLYMVDPFNAECKLNNYPAMWSYIGLMKCLLEMRNDLNDYLKENLVFEVCLISVLKGFLHRKLTFDMLLSIKKYEKMYYTLG